MTQGFTGQPAAVPSGEIIVGNAGGVGTPVAMTGDVTITNAGVTAIKSGVALTGAPTAATASAGTNTTQLATTAFVLANATAPVATTVVNTIPTFSNTTGALQDSGVLINSANALYGEVNLITTQTGSTYTLASTDIGTTIQFTNSSNVTVTVPNNFPVGAQVNLVQMGNGQVQLSPASGAFLYQVGGNTATAGIYAEIWVKVIANSGGSAASYVVQGEVGGNGGVPSPAGGAIIKSLQPFTCTIAAGATSNTVTINAVTLANAYVNYQGITGQATTYAAETCQCYPTLTNTTTVTVTRSTSDASNSLTYYGTVVEYASGVVKSNNQGTITIAASGTSATATITAVVTANSYVHWNGQNFGGATDDANPARCFGKVSLTNTTTITATRTTASATTLTVSYVCIEFVASTVLNSATQSISTSPFTQTSPLQTMLVWGGFITNQTGLANATWGAYQDIGGISLVNPNPSSTGSTPALMVVEFLAGTITAKYQGNPLIAATATTVVDAIPSATTSLSLVCWNGMFATGVLANFAEVSAGIAQSATATVTATRNTSNATIGVRVPYTVLTFA